MARNFWQRILLGVTLIIVNACGSNQDASNKRASLQTSTSESPRIVKSGDEQAVILGDDALPANFADLSNDEKDQVLAAVSAGLQVEEVEPGFNLSYYWRVGRTSYYTNGKCTWWYNPWGKGHYCK